MYRSLFVFALIAGISACNISDPEGSESTNSANNANSENNANSANNANSTNNANASNNANATNNANASNNANSTNSANASNNTNNEMNLGVIETIPAADATDVPVRLAIGIAFDENVDPTSVTASSVTLVTGGTSVGFELTTTENMVELVPPDLDINRQYTVTFSGSIAGESGNTLGSDYSWNFTTQGGLKFVSITPGLGATGVSRSAVIVIEMDGNIDPTSVNSSTVRVSTDVPVDGQQMNQVAGDIAVTGNQLTFVPSAPLQEYHTGYSVTVNPFVAADGRPTEPVGNSTFVTEFWDRSQRYLIFNEQLGEGNALGVRRPEEPVFFFSPSDLGRVSWTTLPYGNGDVLANDRAPGRYLEGSDGTNAAFMSPPFDAVDYYTGQVWFFSDPQSRPLTTIGVGESPFRYHMQTEFQGPNRTLTVFKDTTGDTRARMEDKRANSPEQYWWFRRLP